MQDRRYAVRHDTATASGAALRFVTDGVLLREFTTNNELVAAAAPFYLCRTAATPGCSGTRRTCADGATAAIRRRPEKADEGIVATNRDGTKGRDESPDLR
mgnify:CR=1 FL=1